MTFKDNQHIIAGILLALISALTLAGVSLFAKLISQYLSPIESVLCRNVFAIIPLTLWLIFSGNLNLLKTKRPFAHLLRGTLGTAGVITGFAALSMMPLAETTILLLTAPLFVVILSYPILREPVTLHEILAVIIGFTGVFIANSASLGAESLPPFGIFLGLLWGFIFGSVNICLRWMGNTEKSATTVFYFMLVGIIVASIHLPFAQIPESKLDWNLLLIAIGLGIASLLSQLTKAQSHRMVKASIIAPFSYSTIVWAMLFDYLLWDKAPALNVIAGAALVIGSNLFIFYRRPCSEASSTKPSGTRNDTWQ